MAPRLLFRRALASLIDASLATLLALALALPLVRAAPHQAELVGLSTNNLGCDFPDAEVRTTFNASFAILCSHESALQGTTIYTLRYVVRGEDRMRALAVTPDLTPTTRLPLLPVFVPLIWMIGAIAFQTRNHRTPGKALAGLKLTGQGCLACRELRRLGPILAIGGLGWATAFLNAPSSLMTSGAITLFLTWYYLWPLARWTGAHRWDAATGLTVTKAAPSSG